MARLLTFDKNPDEKREEGKRIYVIMENIPYEQADLRCELGYFLSEEEAEKVIIGLDECDYDGEYFVQDLDPYEGVNNKNKI